MHFKNSFKKYFMSIFKLFFKNFNPNFSFFVDKSREESESKLNLKTIILEKGGGSEEG